MPTVLQEAETVWESAVLDEAEAIVQAEWLRVVCGAGSAHREVTAGLAARSCRMRSHTNMPGTHPDRRPATAAVAQLSRRVPKPEVRATQRSPPRPRREARPSVDRRR